jgi:WD40 repeat protein
MVWQIQQEYGLSVNLDPIPMHILYGHNAPITSVDISNELDIIVSGSLDGTVNIYTILKGHYVRTLSFRNDSISRFTNINVKLSNQRQILVYASGIAHEFVNDISPYKVL